MSLFINHSINTIVVQFLSFAISIGSSIITARALGPEGKGLYTLAVLIPILAVTFARMGVGHAANYLAPKSSNESLIANVAMISAFLGLVTTAIALPAALILKDQFFTHLDTGIMVLTGLAIPLYMLHSHLLSMIQALYEIRFRNLLILVQASTNFTLLIGLVLMVDLSLMGAIIAAIGAIALVVVLSSIFLLKKIDLKNARADMPTIRALLSYGIRTHIGNVLKDLSYRIDILIVSYFLPASSVGLYVAAVNLAEIVWKIPDAIGAVLLPRVASIDAESAKELTTAVCRIVVSIVTVMAIILTLFSRQIIVLFFGSEFEPATGALLILMPGMISLTVWKIIATDMIAEGYPKEYSFTALIALIVGVIFDIWLIPRYGIGGAALASTIAYTSASVAIIYFYTRFTRVSFTQLYVPCRADLLIYQNLIKSIGTGIQDLVKQIGLHKSKGDFKGREKTK